MYVTVPEAAEAAVTVAVRVVVAAAWFKNEIDPAADEAPTIRRTYSADPPFAKKLYAAHVTGYESFNPPNVFTKSPQETINCGAVALPFERAPAIAPTEALVSGSVICCGRDTSWT